MNRNEINTDLRLLSLLNSGRRFLAAIDPHQLLSGLEPTLLVLNFAKKEWSLTLVSDNGKELRISGTIKEKTFYISRFSFTVNGLNRDIDFPASETVSGTLGDLSRVPVSIKHFLSKSGPQKARKDNPYDGNIPFMKTAKDALFYNVEDTAPHSCRQMFQKWKFSYLPSEDDSISNMTMESVCKTQTAVITLSTELDIYGLGNKKVTLVKNLGQEKMAVITCLAKKNQRTVPSLQVAMDLDKTIPPIYFPEIKEVKGKGLPKKSKAR